MLVQKCPPLSHWFIYGLALWIDENMYLPKSIYRWKSIIDYVFISSLRKRFSSRHHRPFSLFGGGQDDESSSTSSSEWTLRLLIDESSSISYLHWSLEWTLHMLTLTNEHPYNQNPELHICYIIVITEIYWIHHHHHLLLLLLSSEQTCYFLLRYHLSRGLFSPL